MTREQWLTDFANNYLWELIGGKIPAHRISVGFPSKSATSRKRRRIGECWPAEATSDKTFEIFVSPLLNVFDSCHVLLHELIHAAVGLKCGHKGPFMSTAKRVGLEGKMTATKPGAELSKKLNEWIKDSEEFPGTQLKFIPKDKKQGTRLIKCECEECGYVCRVTRKWIDEVGPPCCPVHDQMVVA